MSVTVRERLNTGWLCLFMIRVVVVATQAMRNRRRHEECHGSEMALIDGMREAMAMAERLSRFAASFTADDGVMRCHNVDECSQEALV